MREAMKNEFKKLGWVTDDFLEEARRLRGSSRKDPRPKSPISEDIYHSDPRDPSELWFDMFGKEHSKHPNTCWLTKAGHMALEDIECEELQERARSYFPKGYAQTAGANTWTPSVGDRVKVARGGHFSGLVGTVKKTGQGTDGDMSVVEMTGMPSPFKEGCVATAYLEPDEVIFHPRPFLGTIECNGIPESVVEEMLRYSARARESADSIFTLPGNFRPGQRTDGHSEGPILTGNARESYLAIQSGAPDPHAKPGPSPEEPVCDYCKDTGIGESGMRCPVRDCEAVAL